MGIFSAFGSVVSGYQTANAAERTIDIEEERIDYLNDTIESDKSTGAEREQSIERQTRRSQRFDQGRRIAIMGSGGARIDSGTPAAWLAYQAMEDEVTVGNKKYAIRSETVSKVNSSNADIWSARLNIESAEITKKNAKTNAWVGLAAGVADTAVSLATAGLGSSGSSGATSGSLSTGSSYTSSSNIA